MGLLGTISVAGYRQAQQGMEERGVIQNVEQFVRSAYQRALIDRKPTAVHFWNELVREESDDGTESLAVVGKAVAIRTCGRISRINSGVLIDEFGDLEQYDEEGNYAKAPEDDETFRLWQIDDSVLKYTYVKTTPVTPGGSDHGGQQETYITHNPLTDTYGPKNKGTIIQYGYMQDTAGGSTATWYVGAPYCMEFQSIVLPHNYIFGSSYPSSIANPVEDVTSADVIFNSASASGGTVEIYALRPGSSGALTPKSIGQTRSPSSKE